MCESGEPPLAPSVTPVAADAGVLADLDVGRQSRGRASDRPGATVQDGSSAVDASANGAGRIALRDAQVIREHDYGVDATGPTGRVEALMLKDGRPFQGGHVCFFSEDQFVEPAPWDGVRSSADAHLGVPFPTGLWPHFDPVLGSGGPVRQFEIARGMTDAEGRVTLNVPADRSLVTCVLIGMSGIPLTSQPRVRVDEGGKVAITIEAAQQRTVRGRCVDGDGEPLEGILVQVLSPLAERPVSRLAHTTKTGEFSVDVFGDDPEVRVRAVWNYAKYPLGIYESESEVPPVPAETTVSGIVPGEGDVHIWMQPAPLVFIELTIPESGFRFDHLQIEGLAFDPRSAAWGRLGGPLYGHSQRAGGGGAVVGVPKSVAVRPLLVWGLGWAVTAIDPRGRERLAVAITRGRRTSVQGSGWRATDQIRVIAILGPPGAELPCIWVDGDLGHVDRWAHDNSPISAIEFQIVRDGVVVGRSARVPAGTDAAEPVVIDLD